MDRLGFVLALCSGKCNESFFQPYTGKIELKFGMMLRE